jgi:hypothetical protein
MSRREWLEELSIVTERLLDDLREHDPTLRPLRTDIEDLHLRIESELAEECRDHPRLLVVLCGTTLMHSGASGHSREERVAQAKTGTDPSLSDYAGYVSTEGASEKLQGWSDQGAEITYLSAHRRGSASLAASAGVVHAEGFPPGAVFARADGETYDDVVQRALPDVLIEADCASTGPDDIAYPQLRRQLRERIMSIVVPEFGGLRHLPASLATLLGLPA